MRLAVDTGGTFTDLVVTYDDSTVEVYKAPSTPDAPVEAVLTVFKMAAGHSTETLPVGSETPACAYTARRAHSTQS